MPIPVVTFRDHVFAKVHATEVRSLLRALLREATYLPDAVARSFCHRQATTRFRNGRKEFFTARNRSASAQERHYAEQELRKRIANARSALSVLQRANHGDMTVLTKVLLNSYGRTGRRRHELLAPLLQSDALPQNSEALEAIIQQQSSVNPGSVSTVPVPDILNAPTIDENKGVIVCTISDRFGRLKALASAQTRHNFEVRGILPKLRKCAFEMPTKNTWDRQMPRSRIKNAARKWTTTMLSKLLPPLPEHEWERLNAIVHRQQPTEPIKTRRTRVNGRPDNLSPFDLEQLMLAEDDYSAGRYHDISHAFVLSSPKSDASEKLEMAKVSIVQSPDDWLRSSSFVNEVLEEILEDKLQLNRRTSRQLPELALDNRHNITSKLLRRLLVQVLVQCPHIENVGPGNWDVTWGEARSAEEQPATSMAFAPLFASLSESKRNVPRQDQTAKSEPEVLIDR